MNRLVVRIVDCSDAIDAALWDTCFARPLEGRWWYRALETSGLDDQFRFLYGIVERDGVPVGIAPMFTMDVPLDTVVPDFLAGAFRILGRAFRGLRSQRTLFIGSPCSEEGTLGLVAGVDRRAAMTAVHAVALDRARADGLSMVVWKDFPAAYDDDFAALRGSTPLFPLTSFPGTRLVLPTPGYEAWIGSLRSAKRNTYKRKLRKGREALPLVAEHVVRPDAALRAQLFALFMQTYERATVRFERLTPEFFDRLFETPCVGALVLRDSTSHAPVAFMLCYEFGRHLVNKFIGIDYARPSQAMTYFQLWDAFVRHAERIGATELQSGQTGYAPKIELGHRLVPLTNHCRHRNRLMHVVYARVARTVTWSTLDPGLALHVRSSGQADESAASL